MPIFTVEVVEVVVYRAKIEAPSEVEAQATAVQDLIAHAGAGRRSFAEVADRTASVIDD